jgi:hypothetical protein
MLGKDDALLAQKLRRRRLGNVFFLCHVRPKKLPHIMQQVQEDQTEESAGFRFSSSAKDSAGTGSL